VARNVRELKNFIERLIIMTPGQVIRPGDLPADFRDAAQKTDGEPSYFLCPTLKSQVILRARLPPQETRRKRLEHFAHRRQDRLERGYLHRKMKALGIREGDEGLRDSKNLSQSLNS